MKLKNLLMAGAVTTVALASCTSLDDNSTWDGQGGNAVRFSSYIRGQKTVKAAGTAWADGDKVGIYMKAAGAELGAATVANRLYLADARGNLSAAAADQAIAYPESGTVDFVAYYPYTATASGTSVSLDVTDQSNPAAIDLLYSDNAKGVAASSDAVSLGFSHKLSDVVLNVTADATVPSTAGLTVGLAGVPTTGTFDLGTGTLTPATTTGSVAFNVNAAGTAAEAILLPGEASTAKISFTLNGQTKEVAFPVATLAEGSRYTLPVKLTMGEGGSIYVQFGAATITDWTDVPGGNIDVDFGEGGGTVDPTPDPQPGEEVTIFEENLGGGENLVSSNTDIAKFTNWSSGLTFEDVKGTLSVRSSGFTPKLNNIWFPAYVADKANNCDLKISGFSTAGYTKLTLSYDLCANVYSAGETQDVAAVTGTFNGVAFATPSKVLAAPDDKGKLYTFTVELPATAVSATSELHYITGEANTKGIRLTNIKLVGTK